jgi:hypothetical protein
MVDSVGVNLLDLPVDQVIRVSPLHLIEDKGTYTIYYSTIVDYITCASYDFWKIVSTRGIKDPRGGDLGHRSYSKA